MWIAPDDGMRPAAGTLPWAALADTQLIGLPPENKIQQFIENHLAAIGRAHEERLTFQNFETLIAMAAAGVGTAIIPSYAMSACRRHRVRTAMLDEPAASLNFYRVTRRGRAAASAMAAFTDSFISAATDCGLPAGELAS
jgi:DNA-binding transcriptional LysR family regulator